MKFFDNLFDLNNRDEQLVTGLNKELNSVYVYDYFNKYNNNILLVTNSLYEANDLYNRLSNYTDRVLFFPMDDFMTSEASIELLLIKVFFIKNTFRTNDLRINQC